jgi:hypothetical protein
VGLATAYESVAGGQAGRLAAGRRIVVGSMTAGTTSDKKGRKTKKTNYRRRYKSKKKPKTPNTPSSRATAHDGAL